eukprot:Selendium_serpulae@DN4556_c0_g1_i1.p1
MSAPRGYTTQGVYQVPYQQSRQQPQYSYASQQGYPVESQQTQQGTTYQPSVSQPGTNTYHYQQGQYVSTPQQQPQHSQWVSAPQTHVQTYDSVNPPQQLQQPTPQWVTSTQSSRQQQHLRAAYDAAGALHPTAQQQHVAGVPSSQLHAQPVASQHTAAPTVTTHTPAPVQTPEHHQKAVQRWNEAQRHIQRMRRSLDALEVSVKNQTYSIFTATDSLFECKTSSDTVADSLDQCERKLELWNKESKDAGKRLLRLKGELLSDLTNAELEKLSEELSMGRQALIIEQNWF